MEVLLSLEPAPVTQAELDEWLAQPFLDRFRELGGRLDPSRIPRMKPFFDDTYLDPNGYLWLSLPAGPGEIVFAVVDPEGRYLGCLQASGVKREVFVPPVVRSQRLYVIGRDDLDVQRVYVFRIEQRVIRARRTGSSARWAVGSPLGARLEVVRIHGQGVLSVD